MRAFDFWSMSVNFGVVLELVGAERGSGESGKN